jgi:hypothetical protein
MSLGSKEKQIVEKISWEKSNMIVLLFHPLDAEIDGSKDHNVFP